MNGGKKNKAKKIRLHFYPADFKAVKRTQAELNISSFSSAVRTLVRLGSKTVKKIEKADRPLGQQTERLNSRVTK